MRIGLVLGALALVGLAGCTSTANNKPLPDDPHYAPVFPEQVQEPVVATGSIFQTSQVNELYSDLRAHRVGDIVTVVLTEQTQASKSANNKIDKSNSGQIGPVTNGGVPVTINGRPIDLGYSDSFNNTRKAGAGQSNSLSGSITAHVMQVLENGNLVIRGEKWITINNGDEFIRLTGIVRPQDINTDNSILSPRVANARIQYSGTGTFADSQKSGWLSKFFMSGWWPF
ncbi:flagellar basal body L-ring protein FlgH [Paraferrimonas sedimenticola]|uniref:Flagellar L-ring protein n=1 Tax=Paraferrimonas sedimenticola TaxID=375674 RepID=A0AA37VSW4_9GAMM|nr:flagellar basal body L-ring protein FlgH [Paraferrimonas sedimenticola]GLP94989.1 flagellar L-ring protein [Paraferrimonas sedimenticola]